MCIAELSLILMKAFGQELCCCCKGWCERNLTGELAGVKLLGQGAKGILGWEMCLSILSGIYCNFGYVACITFSALWRFLLSELTKCHFKLQKIH